MYIYIYRNCNFAESKHLFVCVALTLERNNPESASDSCNIHKYVSITISAFANMIFNPKK